MKSKCSSCPFGGNGDPELRESVISRNLLNQSQICHHPTLSGKAETHLCRGARDVQLVWLYRLGFIEQPTDRAFSEAAVKRGRDIHD